MRVYIQAQSESLTPFLFSGPPRILEQYCYRRGSRGTRLFRHSPRGRFYRECLQGLSSHPLSLLWLPPRVTFTFATPPDNIPGMHVVTCTLARNARFFVGCRAASFNLFGVRGEQRAAKRFPLKRGTPSLFVTNSIRRQNFWMKGKKSNWIENEKTFTRKRDCRKLNCKIRFNQLLHDKKKNLNFVKFRASDKFHFQWTKYNLYLLSRTRLWVIFKRF